MGKDRGKDGQRSIEEQRAQIESIVAGIRSKKSRLEAEEKLKRILPEASGNVIISLINSRTSRKTNLIRQEFGRRVEEGEALDLKGLWGLAEHYAYITPTESDEYFELLEKALGQSMAQKDQDEVAGFIAGAIETGVDRNTNLLQRAVSHRDDIPDVVEQARLIAEESREIFLDDSVFESTRDRALTFREKREDK